MYNAQMVGVHNLDRFSLRGCFLVMGCFGIVTLISYFNELAKAGLLSGHPRFRRLPTMGFHPQLPDNDDTVHLMRQERDTEKIILQKDGDFHQLNLNLLPLERQVQDNAGNNSDIEPDQGEEIQIALRLRKNDKYLQSNESKTQIYQLHNTLPNFYLRINKSLTEIMKLTDNLSGINRSHVLNFTQTDLRMNLLEYQNHSKVFVYQHDPVGYANRDCFLSLAYQLNMSVAPVPLNALNRKKWELMDRSQREKYEILYGSLSFGACEGRMESCSYAVMISHPLDRLLQAYWLCKDKTNRTMCRFFNTDNVTSVYEFIYRHGNSFFHKLLYYSRHCRLIGHDEMCIHDSNIFFVLSRQEKEEYLSDILSNVANWFSVVGLSEHLHASLDMMRGVLGLNFPECMTTRHHIPSAFYQYFQTYHHFQHLSHSLLASLQIDSLPYYVIREKLLNDTQIIASMSADIEIYAKFLEIFEKQLMIQKEMRKMMSTYFPHQHVSSWQRLVVSQAVNDSLSKNVSCPSGGNTTHCNDSTLNVTHTLQVTATTPKNTHNLSIYAQQGDGKTVYNDIKQPVTNNDTHTSQATASTQENAHELSIHATYAQHGDGRSTSDSVQREPESLAIQKLIESPERMSMQYRDLFIPANKTEDLDVSPRKTPLKDQDKQHSDLSTSGINSSSHMEHTTKPNILYTVSNNTTHRTHRYPAEWNRVFKYANGNQ